MQVFSLTQTSFVLCCSFTKSILLDLWIVRYICTALLFLIGFKAPGLPGNKYRAAYRRIQTSREDGDEALLGTEPEQPPSEPTTWSDLGRKLRTLLPYIWPQNNFLSQLSVVCCILLLIAGRSYIFLLYTFGN